MLWQRPVSRRQVLKAGTLASAALLVPFRFARRALAGEPELPFLDPATLTRFVAPLPVPPVWTGAQLSANGLTMAPALHQFHPQMDPTPAWGYAGASYLGPTIEVQRGVPLSYVARNRLGEHPLTVDTALNGANQADDQHFPRAAVHLHGGYTEAASDGGPLDTFLPGEDYTYHYANDQQAGTIWYHDHGFGITRLNVYAGLAAFYLVRDAEREAGLPPAPFDIPIAIQDRRFLVDGTAGTNPLYYPSPWEPEFFGDVAVVNGTAWPNLDVARGWYRFRVLNGSSSRFYNLRLTPARPMVQLGTESGLLAQPRHLRQFVLAPGERIDLAVDFSRAPAGTRVRLVNQPLPAEVVSPADLPIDQIMQFTVTGAAGFAGPLPETFGPFTALSASSAVRQRNVLLTEIMDPETGEPAMALLNARPFDTDEVERPTVDTLEQWNIINLTADTHPIHIHLVQFQPLDRQRIDAERYLLDVFGVSELTPAQIGSGSMPFPAPDSYAAGSRRLPKAYEAGWKDTVQAHPGMVTRVLVPFGPNAAAGIPFGTDHLAAPFSGRYVWHCHILDHEDNEMMLPYEVVAG
jgi:FtsP/CotA-like multicopper oxidase with cupredoxin domain